MSKKRDSKKKSKGQDLSEQSKGVESKKKKRRSIVSTLSASLLSDEKNTSGSVKERVSTDILKQVLQGARNSRTEIANRVSGEVARLLKKIDVSSEIKKILAENRIRISAEIEFIPKDDPGTNESDPLSEETTTESDE